MTLRFASPDVIHGLLVTGTNVNTMVIPGYVSQVHTEFTRTGDLLMPCHEYCGLGHSEMWATVQVIPDRTNSSRARTGGFPVRNVERLCLAHFWVAFAAFLVACRPRHLADVGAKPAGAPTSARRSNISCR